MRKMLALLVLTMGVLAVCASADTTETTREDKIAIYVGPQVREGFVDVDRGILDSIKDLQDEFRKSRLFRVARTPDDASLILFVLGRRVVGNAGGVGVPIGAGMTAVLAVERRAVDATLRAGTYERTMVGVGEDSWKAPAKQLVKDVTIWAEANRKLLKSPEARLPVVSSRGDNAPRQIGTTGR